MVSTEQTRNDVLTARIQASHLSVGGRTGLQDCEECPLRVWPGTGEDSCVGFDFQKHTLHNNEFLRTKQLNNSIWGVTSCNQPLQSSALSTKEFEEKFWLTDAYEIWFCLLTANTISTLMLCQEILASEALCSCVPRNGQHNFNNSSSFLGKENYNIAQSCCHEKQIYIYIYLVVKSHQQLGLFSS